MDFLQFSYVLFCSEANIGHLCEELNNILAEIICSATFKIQNTKWLWFVNDVVTAMNSNKILRLSFGLCPSFVAGILNSVKEIHFCSL
jgi:hypothetical protein